jgi:hypothetical protein
VFIFSIYLGPDRAEIRSDYALSLTIGILLPTKGFENLELLSAGSYKDPRTASFLVSTL